MLHIQAASENALKRIDHNITVVQYGEKAFSQIRRFVVVNVRRGFVYAWYVYRIIVCTLLTCSFSPITTYTSRGTLKHGCVPSEHSVVYFEGSQPCFFEGEEERGLTKKSIRVKPASPELSMDPASRLHYGKVYPIEMNVKVKDIGDVDPTQISLLLQYYREENSADHHPNTHPQQNQTQSGYQGYNYPNSYTYER